LSHCIVEYGKKGGHILNKSFVLKIETKLRVLYMNTITVVRCHSYV